MVYWFSPANLGENIQMWVRNHGLWISDFSKWLFSDPLNMDRNLFFGGEGETGDGAAAASDQVGGLGDVVGAEYAVEYLPS